MKTAGARSGRNAMADLQETRPTGRQTWDAVANLTADLVSSGTMRVGPFTFSLTEHGEILGKLHAIMDPSYAVEVEAPLLEALDMGLDAKLLIIRG